MESVSVIAQAMRKGMWATSLDLVSGYNHLSINPKNWEILSFMFEDVTYMYTTLPFGLNIAPREFSKVVGAAVKILRMENILLFFDLDDILILAPNRETSLRWTARTVELFQELGFIISAEKSVLTPTQRIEHLGVLFDLEVGKLVLTEKKVDKIRCMVKEFVQRKTVEIRTLAKLNRQIIFATVAVPSQQHSSGGYLANKGSGGFDQCFGDSCDRKS
ncbi:hypothetical protein AKO1_005596 [Acrasis kona]|uniref:Reverse transcriptase domain-containing protein n=1 Tax=Acrasis kona TaxID=1008807 RepID=A0AAW2YIC5_9EUKA